jgi:[acyl-carrier-protein] S-malonyltransferase
MGAALLADPEIAGLARRCSDAAGVDLRHLLVDAPDDELRLTGHAQPALLFMGVGLARLLARRGIEPAAAAGHSVGEYTALCVAGAVSPEDGVRAVAERGRAMAEASPPGTSSMMAVIGIAPERVEEALQGLEDVWPANYNTHTQTVIGGTVEALARAQPRLEGAGARRVLPLNVAGAFHTPLVAGAGVRLRGVLDQIVWRTPEFPVMANVHARAYQAGDNVPDALERQLSSPVRWIESVTGLLELGCDTFVEVGPKRALAGMMRELAPGRAATSLATPAAVEQYSRLLLSEAEQGTPC